MSDTRAHLEWRDLFNVARAAFSGHELVSVQRLPGGTRKGVYRLLLDDGTTSIAYVWHADENYWPDGHDQGGPLNPASGLGLFVNAHSALRDIGSGSPG